MSDQTRSKQVNLPEAALVGKFILMGRLQIFTPLIVGGGSSLYGDSDIIVLKDEKGQPYIPATSIIGVLKHRFDEELKGDPREENDSFKKQKSYFWGGSYLDKNKDGKMVEKLCQSALLISDARLTPRQKAVIKIRDGIRINPATGIVDQGAKFDYETVAAGVSFDFKLEVNLRKAFEKDLFQAIIGWMGEQLITGQVAFGAMTAQGFGRCQLEDYHYYEFNFNEKKHILAWLQNDPERQKWPEAELHRQEGRTFIRARRDFRIRAGFNIKNSLIVRSYSGNPKDPDAVHLKSGENNVLPATSVRGAIRSRAARIINTLDGNGPEMLKELFGWVSNEPSDTEEAIRGRIVVEEILLSRETVVEEIQKRIRIDRFTGGVINGALFDSMPLWPVNSGENPEITIDIRIKEYSDWEAGLLLLVLKDIWIGDLAIGGEKNVGRGVLQGVRAEVYCGDVDIPIVIKEDKKDEKLLEPEQAQYLEEYVNKLLQEIEKRWPEGINAIREV